MTRSRGIFTLGDRSVQYLIPILCNALKKGLGTLSLLAYRIGTHTRVLKKTEVPFPQSRSAIPLLDLLRSPSGKQSWRPVETLKNRE